MESGTSAIRDPPKRLIGLGDAPGCKGTRLSNGLYISSPFTVCVGDGTNPTSCGLSKHTGPSRRVYQKAGAYGLELLYLIVKREQVVVECQSGRADQQMLVESLAPNTASKLLRNSHLCCRADNRGNRLGLEHVKTTRRQRNTYRSQAPCTNIPMESILVQLCSHSTKVRACGKGMGRERMGAAEEGWSEHTCWRSSPLFMPRAVRWEHS